MDANPEVVEALRRTLRYFDRPLKRGELVREVSGRCRAHGWSLATWSRRIREAVAVLISEGIPVVSDGTGFRIARTQDEMEIPLRMLEHQIRSLCVKYAQAKGIPLHQVAKQPGLFDGMSIDIHAAQ